MVQKTIVQLIDDLDGGTAKESVTFGLDGRAYELDLSAANAAKLRDALASYVGAGRKLGGHVSGRVPSQRAEVGASDAGAVREWALANGYAIGDRGRIPLEIRAAYEQRQTLTAR